MSCYHPLKIFYTGQKTESGKKEGVLSFTNDDIKIMPLSEAEKRLGHKIEYKQGFVAYGRYTESGYLYNFDYIPCGHCIGCRLDKAKDWTTRLEAEIKKHPKNNYFLTITYDEEHCPLSLTKRDIQLFLKKIRKNGKCRFFVAGEYGGQTARPHYHMILLNHEPGKIKQWDKQLSEFLDLEKIWGKGRILGCEANSQTISYTCQYTVKKAYELDKNWPENLQKPFILMSRRPGLGHEYIEEQIDKTTEEAKIYITGRKKIPRYMKDKIEKKRPDLAQQIEEVNKELAKQYNKQNEHIYNTSRRTTQDETQEQIKIAKINTERRRKL